MLLAVMNLESHRQRASRALAVLLLALVVGAQFGLAGHHHADGNHAADCLQCQFDHSKAALPTSSPLPFKVSPETALTLTLPVGTVPAHYHFNARGPPALS